MRGPHFHLPLVAWCLDSGLSVPCFGSKDLSCNCQPCASQHQHITTKPNPEVKIRNLSSLCCVFFFFFFNHKRAEGRKACPFDTDYAVMIREERQRMENSSVFSSVSWQYSDDISAIRIHNSVHLKHTGISSVFTYKKL